MVRPLPELLAKTTREAAAGVHKRLRQVGIEKGPASYDLASGPGEFKGLLIHAEKQGIFIRYIIDVHTFLPLYL